jgi:hypothetical protein
MGSTTVAIIVPVNSLETSLILVASQGGRQFTYVLYIGSDLILH